MIRENAERRAAEKAADADAERAAMQTLTTTGAGSLDVVASTGSLTMAADATLNTVDGDIRITAGDGVADQVMGSMGERLPYLVGTMIELPRAALLADELAGVADFFSFGTNDLTQTTFGLSRDDAGRFLPQYLERGLLEADPFQVLDQRGVGKLVQWALRDGRTQRPELKAGI